MKAIVWSVRPRTAIRATVKGSGASATGKQSALRLRRSNDSQAAVRELHVEGGGTLTPTKRARPDCKSYPLDVETGPMRTERGVLYWCIVHDRPRQVCAEQRQIARMLP